MPRAEPTQAKNTPVNAPVREMHTADLPDAPIPDIALPASGDIERGESIAAIERLPNQDYLDALAFGEDALTIRIEPSDEENAPRVIDCWVNGKGAEVFANGKWTELGCIPIGGLVITKRKYVEVLARSKVERVKTVHGSQNDENPDNRVVRTPLRKALFSVINDPSPKGAEWLTRLYAER